MRLYCGSRKNADFTSQHSAKQFVDCVAADVLDIAVIWAEVPSLVHPHCGISATGVVRTLGEVLYVTPDASFSFTAGPASTVGGVTQLAYFF